MREHDLVQVDAFTHRPFEGNSCAVVFDADDLDAARMQAIAREMNLSETAFVRSSQVADFAARYFTPAEEIPLAGHPTLAVIWALIECGSIRLRDGITAVRLELREGPISVEVHSADGEVRRISMAQRKPRFLRTYDTKEVLPVFGLSPAAGLAGVPVQTVSTGTPQLMIPLADPEALRSAVLDIRLYGRLRAAGDFFSPHLFCLTGSTEVGRTSARHFGVPPDTPEDPFTGSATGGMAAYLWRYGLIDEPTFVAEQGYGMRRPGRAWVEVVGPRDDIETVKVGGQAVTVLRGTLVA